MQYSVYPAQNWFHHLKHSEIIRKISCVSQLPDRFPELDINEGDKATYFQSTCTSLAWSALQYCETNGAGRYGMASHLPIHQHASLSHLELKVGAERKGKK